MTIEEQLRQLVIRHHANLHEQIAIVTQLLEARDEQGQRRPGAVEAQGITHQLKGTAGSMGFPVVSAAASALDDNLKVLKRETPPIPEERLKPSLDLLAELRRIADETTPEMSTLYNVDLKQLARQ